MKIKLEGGKSVMLLNNLKAKAWVKLSKSTWITQNLLAWRQRAPLNASMDFLVKKQINSKPSGLMMTDHMLDETRVQLIQLLTREGQRVLDPYLALGDALQAAIFAKRELIGIGETPTQCQQAIDRLDQSQRGRGYVLLDHQSDKNPLVKIADESIDLLLSEIPWFDFNNHKDDYWAHLEQLKKDIHIFAKKIKPQAYVTLIVADQRFKETYYCRHADIIQLLNPQTLCLQGLINVIRDSQYLKSYGYPSHYVPNIINQYVIVAKKINKKYR